jgi:hypothetical protein
MKCYIPLVQAPLIAGMQLPYMHTPQSQVSGPGVGVGTCLLTLEDRREGGVKDAQSMFSAKKSCA